MKVKAPLKALIIAVVLGGGIWYMDHAGYFDPKATIATSVPDKIDLPGTAPATVAPIVGTVVGSANGNGTKIRVKTIPWNATAGMHFANGGATTQPGSLVAKRGINATISREDDYMQLMAGMAAQAADPNTGVHFVIIMGDGAPAFMTGLNDALKPYKQNGKIVAALGYSRGEDKCIVADGVDARGSVIAGYLGDGDINICVKYAADNGIAINADPKIYDSTAMNFAGTGSFVEADQKFIASAKAAFRDNGSCETRAEAIDGKKTGKNVKVCVNGTATWTPGDTNVFDSMAKLGVSIKVLASTKEYAWQMSSTLIGNEQWMAKNPEATKAFIAALLEGGEQVRNNQAALDKAGEVQAEVYKENTGAYWSSLFKGITKNGPNGKPVALGGSTTNSLADNAFLFGLNGNDNLYKKVYTVYGNIAVKYFADTVPRGLLPYDSVVDTSYLQALLASSTNMAAAATPTYNSQSTEVFATRSFSIEFDSGKATFTQGAVRALNDLVDQNAVNSLSMVIGGHTDSQGDPGMNLALSKARADAVKNFLMTNMPGNFTAERIVSRGYGDTMPVGDNTTVVGRAKNRRVEIVLKK